ncbi:MAG TPA: phosphate starvation-inducible protein PhoH [Alphaproteobacteria bacterium]|nr:phosphate starvation-inducible protein PhoH [Alphaproteobacteria bacterium]
MTNKNKAEKLNIELDNKDYLLQVCGVNDSNLKFLEERLKVQIIPRGNTLSILGTTHDSYIAYNVIYSIYELCATGLDISVDHVKSALKIEKNKEKSQSKDILKENKNEQTFNTNNKLIVTPLIKVAPRTPAQKEYIEKLRKNTVSFSVGPAGTGKTYLATALAVEKLMRKEISKIVLTRPVVEAGENLGFLPGTLEEKIDPYLRPFFDAINEMIGAEKVQKLIEQSVIEIAPLAYMRGRTIKNSFMLLDEAQNTTTMQMKMFLTRLGENSQMVVTGDLSQIDLPYKQKSGLQDAVDRLDNIDDITILKFTAKDVIRHELVSKIVQAYETEETKED